MICIFIWLYIIALSFSRRCWQEIKQKLIFSSGDRQSSKDSPDREARTKKGKTSYNLLLLSQLSRWAHFYIWGGPISIFEVSPFLYLWWALFTFQLSRWAHFYIPGGPRQLEVLRPQCGRCEGWIRQLSTVSRHQEMGLGEKDVANKDVLHTRK